VLLARALVALGRRAEARFSTTAQARELAGSSTPPPYRGAGDRAALAAHLAGPVRRWIERRRVALDLAERAYLQVFGVDVPRPRPPSPPPPPPSSGLLGLISAGAGGTEPTAPWGLPPERDPLDPAWAGRARSAAWAVAAAAQVGLAWGAFADALPSQAVSTRPATWETVRDTWGEPIDGPAEEPARRAKLACETALRLVLRERIADERAGACVDWLARHYRAEHVKLEELRPRITAPFAAGEFAPADAR
jgi:hypothetical protein